MEEEGCKAEPGGLDGFPLQNVSTFPPAPFLLLKRSTHMALAGVVSAQGAWLTAGMRLSSHPGMLIGLSPGLSEVRGFEAGECVWKPPLWAAGLSDARAHSAR